jgi:anti-sigma regulatory factor (Ser/Thr protein kinase)
MDRTGQAGATVHAVPGLGADPAAVRPRPVRSAAPDADAGARVGRPRHIERPLIGDIAVRVGSTLDPTTTAKEVVEFVTAGFADHASLLLRESISNGDGAAEPREGPIRLLRLALGGSDPGFTAKLRAALPVGGLTIAAEGSSYAVAMRTRTVLVEEKMTAADAAKAVGPRYGPELDRLLIGSSAIYAPLLAGGVVLGVLICSRSPGRKPFTEHDVAAAVQLADRAAVWMDNARLYHHQHRTALIMQQAFLPRILADPVGLETAHRYLPGSDAAVVGGDWFDVIELSGGRVALVVGDVMGHGTRAATAMAQLRTAVRTLAVVDLAPAEVLSYLDNMMPGIDENLFATCIYAVYDPVTQKCEIARAGHVPPLLVLPDGSTEVLHRVAPGLPLGLGSEVGTYGSLEIEVPEGALFVLCTDGLLENKARDIDSGLDLLRANLADPHRPLQEICDHVVEELDLNRDRDDIALLIARVHPLPADRSVAWRLPGDPQQVALARRLVRETLVGWGLTHLVDTTELLVSELVTNAIQHAGGELRLRLQRDRALLCEVCDSTPNPPELREFSATAEHGRGILLVNALADKWNFRRTASGKVVWFELTLPRQPAAQVE